MYTLALKERDFKSGSLLPQGEGLGMRATNLRTKKIDLSLLILNEIQHQDRSSGISTD
jgi:hypothetical protein